IWQAPFSFCVLRPHNFRSNQRNFLDHQAARKERKETNAQPECSSLQEIFRPDRYCLRNRDAAKFKSAPGSDAHAANFERNAEAASQFLLNLSLCPLGLHIQVHAQQNHCTESNQCPHSDHCQPAQFLHPQMLRSPSLKQRPKPSRHSERSEELQNYFEPITQTRIQPEMFRYVANEHGNRFVWWEYRPVA